MSLPNLIVIGAMKCGTTSLHAYLDQHPDIAMSAKKELNFFVEEQAWSNGLDWYKSQFDPSVPCRGESSQNYTKRQMHAGIPARMAAHIPEAKLIYLLRDPIARLSSHYYENMEGGQLRGSLNEYLQEYAENHYVQTSQYYWQLEAFLPYFSKEQILLLESERLRTERLKVMNEIFRFLGLAELDSDAVFDFEANHRSAKRQVNALDKWVKSEGTSGLRKFLPRGLKDKVKQSALYQAISSKPIVVNERLHPELEAAIRSYLKQDVEALRSFSNLPFSSWSV